MKAVFAVALVAPAHYMALSNMTVKKAVTLDALQARSLGETLNDVVPGE